MPGARVREGQTHPAQQPMQSWLPESSRETQFQVLENSLMPPSVHMPEVSPGQRAHYFSARDKMTQDGEPFAHPGAKDLYHP